MTRVPRHANFNEHLAQITKALDAEIAHVRCVAREDAFELTSGKRESPDDAPGAIYVFSLADAQHRLRDDTPGTLHVDDIAVPVCVVEHEGNRVWLQIADAEDLPDRIQQARLEISETELLERLRERMGELRGASAGLAAETFGYQPILCGAEPLPERVAERVGEGPTRAALEQCLGSEVTFVWGPPGTGKTFSIAALVAALIDGGETVLVTAHTHAAVEQALWQAVEPASDERDGGLLAGSELVAQGRVLKVGPLRDTKIPAECHLEGQLAIAAAERARRREEVRASLATVRAQLRESARALELWRNLDKAEVAHGHAWAALCRAVEAEGESSLRLAEDTRAFHAAEERLMRACSSLPLGRRRRIRRAEVRRAEAGDRLAADEQEMTARADELAASRMRMTAAEEQVGEARAAAHACEDRSALEHRVAWATAEVERLSALAAVLGWTEQGALARQLLDDARALFATLTKLYLDSDMCSRSWDTVIIDEASMALPPLVAWATSRARRRVVVCGDFKQLPPIVRSPECIAVEELATDIFRLRGIPEAVRAEADPPELVQLDVQRRMRPEIATVARKLAYGPRLTDHATVSTRPVPNWLLSVQEESGLIHFVRQSAQDGSAAPALVIADTSSESTWSGRVRGRNGSRFNITSARLALELAAQMAQSAPRPEPGEARPIGVVTPYAAQRQYLTKLLEVMGELSAWVTVGTVHTFQGNECDVIIFDTALAPPQRSSRLTIPQRAVDVKRELNVAVTRARHQFILLGDAAWLDRHATDDSGLGALWEHLGSHAVRVAVHGLAGNGHCGSLSAEALRVLESSDAGAPGAVTLLDEQTFDQAFLTDLGNARDLVVLFTPYFGTTRWPRIEPFVKATAARGVKVLILHKPLSDPAWRRSDTTWGASVLAGLAGAGVKLLPVHGIHAKSIVIDGRVVYEGSLNWASYLDTYEHMLRVESPAVAALYEQTMQIREIAAVPGPTEPGGLCPYCGGRLILINQGTTKSGDPQPLKLGCSNHAIDRDACPGYVRDLGERVQGTSAADERLEHE